MNAKNLFLLASLAFAMPLSAQSPLEDFKRDITLSGSNYVAYRGPQKQLTPAPKGYKPFYLSHYGRHGSRFMIGNKAYDVPYFSLLKAKQEGKLTAKGEETLAKVKLIREDAKGRDGELTPLGALQHQGIARRMMERFPEIFAGNTNIEARSTVVSPAPAPGLPALAHLPDRRSVLPAGNETDGYRPRSAGQWTVVRAPA